MLTNLTTRIRLLAAVSTIGLFGAAAAPALSEDGFMAIYMDNQKADSDVAAYWGGEKAPRPALTLAPAPAQDGFMAIHMDNQKIGSAVSLYWHGVLTASE